MKGYQSEESKPKSITPPFFNNKQQTTTNDQQPQQQRQLPTTLTTNNDHHQQHWQQTTTTTTTTATTTTTTTNSNPDPLGSLHFESLRPCHSYTNRWEICHGCHRIGLSAAGFSQDDGTHQTFLKQKKWPSKCGYNPYWAVLKRSFISQGRKNCLRPHLRITYAATVPAYAWRFQYFAKAPAYADLRISRFYLRAHSYDHLPSCYIKGEFIAWLYWNLGWKNP